MAIFGQYQGGDPFQVGPNMQGVLAGQKAVHESMYNGVEKIIQAKQEMDVLRSTTQSVLSQYSLDESGKPSPAAPKYIHDLYKSVEKEGGIQGLSKSSLVAVLKGYETGLQVDGQRMQIQAAQQQATLRGYEIQKAEREADEYKKLALAHKLALEAAGTPSGKKEMATAPTSAYDMTPEMGDEIYKYQTGQRSTDPRQEKQLLQPTPIAPAKAATTPAPKPTTKSSDLLLRNSPERDALEAKLNIVGANRLLIGLEERLKSTQAKLEEIRSAKKVRVAITGTEIPASTYESEKTLDEIRADKLKEPTIVAEIDSIKKEIAETKKLADAKLPDEPTRPAGATPVSKQVKEVGTGRLPSLTNDNYRFAVQHLKDKNNSPEEIDKQVAKLEQEASLLETAISRQGDSPTLMAEFGEWITDSNRVAGVTYQQRNGKEYVSKGQKEINDLALKRQQIDELTNRKPLWDAYKEVLAEGAAYTNPIGPTGKPPEEPAPTPVPSSIFKKGTSRPLQKAKPSAQPSPKAQPAPRAVNSNPAVKSDDEKIAEEYGIITSRLKGLGGVPMNWSEDTFRQMRGYAPKIKIVQQGGIALVGIGDKWQVIKTGAENQMSPSELATTEKHAVWKDSIRTDRLSNAKWTFRGDIRTTEADTAGKVKKAVTDSTRALEALDKLIDLGETGFWDSITPSDKSGVIEGVTNSVQAAGRTEIAGSGAFSEQDAKKLEAIVPSMASISGAVFREKSLTMLKTYRERIAMQVGDIGRTWGFEVKETKNAGLTEAQIAAIRGAYTDLIKQGYNHEDAKKLAIESLNQ